ncbi:MAG: MATE family efflux transporter [bacterium]
MPKTQDLTKGNILGNIFKMAMPVIATSLIQMTYSLTDMIWIGKISSEAVAAIGTAGFLIWFGFSFILITKVGAEIGVSQSLGKGDLNLAKLFSENSIQLSLFMSIIFGVVMFLFRGQFVQFYGFKQQPVINMSISYLGIISFSSVVMFLNPVFSGIYNGSGNSRTPFYINSIGLALNIIFDPFLIFGIGFFPALGIVGAAWSTVLSQVIVTVIFLFYLKHKKQPLPGLNFLKLPSWNYIIKIIRFGLPITLQSLSFSVFAIFLARIISQWGALPIAAQKIGIQVEGISYMTASGFSTALCAFIGQNFGAAKWNRIFKGYYLTMGLISILGLVTSAILWFWPEFLVKLFVHDAETVSYGVSYLKILALSQLLMCYEIISAGAFNGLGRTIPPSIIGIIFTGLRIPLAVVLSEFLLLGLDGVWWSITITSIVKGTILSIWFGILLELHPQLKGKVKTSVMVFRWNWKYLKEKILLAS